MKRSYESLLPEGDLYLDDYRGSMMDRGFSKKTSPEAFSKLPYYREKLENDYEIRILIPHGQAGAVIGRRGTVITRLRTQYPGVAVRVPESMSPERVVDIWSQSLDDVIGVFKDVVLMLQSDLGTKVLHAGDEFEVRLLCSHDQMASITSSNSGNWLQDVGASNGVRLKVFPKLAPQSTDRVLSLIGLPIDIVSVVTAILEHSSDQANKPSFPVKNEPYEPTHWDGALCHEYGGYSNGEPGPDMKVSRPPQPPPRRANQRRPPPPPARRPAARRQPSNRGGAPPPPAPVISLPLPGLPRSDPPRHQMVSIQYTLPETYVGAIIGRRGDNIRNIRQISGADITIREEGVRSGERIITIRGTQTQVDEATTQLQSCAYEEEQAQERRRLEQTRQMLH